MPSLFVSQSSRDDQVVGQLVEWLAEQGYVSLFLDADPERGVAAGARWEAELYSQLRRADAVVFVASAASVESRWCFAELAMARSLGKPIIPVSLAEDVAHPLLADLQRVVLAGSDGFARLARALRLAELDPAHSFAWDGCRSPFPGLEAFGERDAGVFFGRGPEIEQLLELLGSSRRRHTGRLLAVVGPSGSGKSSLVAAGVLPRLRRARARWLVLPSLRPGERPRRQLARALAGAFSALGEPRELDAVELALNAGPQTLVALVEELGQLRPDASEPAVLVVVDQAEELVTLAPRPDCEQFLDLLRAATRGSSPLWAVLTLRSEFLSELLQLEGGSQLFDDQVLVGPLDRARLAGVIERPAARAGTDLEPGLVGRMVEDTGGGDALPLLAFTLSELYERARRRAQLAITGDDYEQLGGVIGALQRRADAVAARLRDDGLDEAVLPTLVRLVTLGPEGQPTRRRLARRRLDRRAAQVVDAFLEARLLTSGESDGEPVIEVAHEALLRQWPPLVDAIERHREELRLRTDLERAAADWERNERRDDYLFTGERLRGAQRLGDHDRPDPIQRFLGASISRERREANARRRRARRAFAALGVALLIVSALGIVAVIQARRATIEAKRATDQRDTVQANQLATEALSRLGDDPGEGLTLATRAWAKKHTNLTEAALRLTASQAAPQLRWKIDQGRMSGVAFAGDGRHLASAGSDGTVRVFDWRAPRTAPTLLRTGQHGVNAVAFAGDGRHLASAGIDGTVRVVDWRAPRTAPTLLRTPHRSVNAVAFAGDGRHLASAGPDGTVRVVDWRAPRTAPTILRTGQDGVNGVAFAGDGRHLASAGSDGTVRVFDWRAPRTAPTILRTGQDGVNGVAFAGDGRHLASAGSDGTVRVFDWRAPRTAPTILRTGKDGVNGVAFAGDGRHLASAGFDGTVRVFDWRAPTTAPTILRTGQGSVNAVAFAGDGRHLASAGDDGTVRVFDWRAPRTAPTLLRTGQDGVNRVAFAGDGRHLASAGSDGTVRVFDWRAPTTAPTILRTRQESVFDVAFAGDGRHLASAGDDGTVRVFDWRAPRTAPTILRTRQDGVNGVAFAGDGRHLASAGSDGTVRVFDWRAPRTAPTILRTGQDGVNGVAFAGDGRHLASAGFDGTVRVFDWRAPRTAPTILRTGQGSVNGVAFAGDGRHLASAGDDGTVRVFDWRAPRTAPTILRTRQEIVNRVAFAGDGRHLASAGFDGTVRVFDWRAPTTAPTILRTRQEIVFDVAFAGDGRHLASVGFDGKVRVFACERCGSMQAILALGQARLPRDIPTTTGRTRWP